MKSLADDIIVVLSRATGGANIGSVCRAMRNMGFSSLVLADCKEIRHTEWIDRMAVHAMDIYENAVITDTLEEALRGCVLSAGITRRRGSKRKVYSLLPEQLAEKAASSGQGKIALVFGNEKHGLSDEELSFCSLTCHIPSNPEFPSLNLSHAVQVMLYEFYRYGYDDSRKFKAVTREENLALTEKVMGVFNAMDFFKPSDNFDMRQYWQDILTRAQLSRREARMMENIFMKIGYRYRKAKSHDS